MHNYECFYNGKSTILQAKDLYSAKLAAIAFFKPPKSKQHMISAVLIDSPIDPASL